MSLVNSYQINSSVSSSTSHTMRADYYLRYPALHAANVKKLNSGNIKQPPSKTIKLIDEVVLLILLLKHWLTSTHW